MGPAQIVSVLYSSKGFRTNTHKAPSARTDIGTGTKDSCYICTGGQNPSGLLYVSKPNKCEQVCYIT